FSVRKWDRTRAIPPFKRAAPYQGTTMLTRTAEAASQGSGCNQPSERARSDRSATQHPAAKPGSTSPSGPLARTARPAKDAVPAARAPDVKATPARRIAHAAHVAN